jgi:fibronectin-binding autotransporter adhesin
MQIKNSLIAFVLGLGLTLALVSLLGGGRLPVARAASFTVTKKSDGNDGACDADCSLREAIVAANSNDEADIITLGFGRFGLTITGTGENAAATGDLDVTGPLTITGRGPGQTIIDASGVISDRVFDMRSGAGTVVISGVTIMNGNVTGQGGGIYNYNADLTLVNVEVRNNVVTGTSSQGRGGGIYVNQGSLSLDGVQIVSNTANIYGGGVYFNQGSGTLSSGQIVSNTASGGGGVIVFNAAAAFTQTGDSMVAYNAAGRGGGVHIYQGSATLLEGQILSNTADLYGGGVIVYQAGARFTMSGGQIISNTAGDRGGGVYVYFGSSAVLSGGRVAGNTAPDGGGVYVANSNTAFDP